MCIQTIIYNLKMVNLFQDNFPDDEFPQAPEHDRGTWANREDYTRDLIQADNLFRILSFAITRSWNDVIRFVFRAFNLLPETFTMKEVQELDEAIFDKPFARNNFRKKILDLNVLERLEKKFTGAANKAPYLYRFLK